LGEHDGLAHKVEHHQEQLDGQLLDGAPCPRQQNTQRRELAPTLFVSCIISEELQRDLGHVQSRRGLVDGGEEASRAEVAVPLFGSDVDGLLRVAQSVLDAILFFVDGGAGVV